MGMAGITVKSSLVPMLRVEFNQVQQGW